MATDPLHCPRCGAVVAAKGTAVRFCYACGQPLGDPVPSAARPAPIRRSQDARISLLCIAWFPAAIVALPLLAALMSIEQLTWPANMASWAVLIAVYFGPFLAGVAFGLRAVGRRRSGPPQAAAVAGLLGNAGIITISVLFVVVEVMAGS